MLYQQMKRRKEEICAQIKRLEKEIKKLPDGTLRCARSQKCYKWYFYREGTRTYLPKSRKNLAEKLAMKRYFTLQLEKLLAEERALDAYLKKYNSKPQIEIEQFLENPEYCKLIEPFFKPISQELKEWCEQPYEKYDKYPERLNHKTQAGIWVRSKSEAMILTVLYRNKIPFRYECVLHLGGVTMYPDFTIRHPKTGELFYWEHFGQMDVEQYCNRYQTKMSTYISNGIIPTINLIATYETKDHPLSIETIEKYVQHYFLE